MKHVYYNNTRCMIPRDFSLNVFDLYWMPLIFLYVFDLSVMSLISIECL